MSTLPSNTLAPEFNLPDQDGREHTLAYHIKNATTTKPPTRFILIYFYPKDDTPGCTAEACAIRDAYGEFAAHGIKVFGISADTPASHKKFAAKYNLPFTLLADPTKATIRAYGAIRESGVFKGGTARVSYLIAASDTSVGGTTHKAGTILRVYPKVDPANHAAEILHDIESIQ